MIQEQFPIQTHDAFISYRHETGFYMAQIIYTHLIANGYSVFMDKTMDSGRYEEKIKLAIKKCKNFIVVLFPDDYESCTKEDSWLNREASTALDYNVPNIVPVMCDGFPKDKKDDEFSDFAEPMRKIMKHNGLRIHKDYSLDRDLDSLCDKFLKNTNSNKPKVSTADFFRYN